MKKYFEDEHHGGVEYDDGTQETADVVVAADGVGSDSSILILGEKQAAISSGYACHLATYPAEIALKNTVIRDGYGDFQTGVWFSLGPDAHLVIGKSDESITWVLVHKVSRQSLVKAQAYICIDNDRTSLAQMKAGATPFPRIPPSDTWRTGRPSTAK